VEPVDNRRHATIRDAELHVARIAIEDGAHPQQHALTGLVERESTADGRQDPLAVVLQPTSVEEEGVGVVWRTQSRERQSGDAQCFAFRLMEQRIVVWAPPVNWAAAMLAAKQCRRQRADVAAGAAVLRSFVLADELDDAATAMRLRFDLGEQIWRHSGVEDLNKVVRSPNRQLLLGGIARVRRLVGRGESDAIDLTGRQEAQLRHVRGGQTTDVGLATLPRTEPPH